MKKKQSMTFFLFAYWHDPLWKDFVGATVKIWDMAKHLSEQGNDVTLYLPKYGFAKYNPSFEVVQVPVINFPFLRMVSFNFFLIFFLLVKARRKKPDIIYLRRTRIVVPLLYASIIRMPFFFEVNDNPYYRLHSDQQNLLSGFQKSLTLFLDEWHLKKADRIFVISQKILNRINSENPSIAKKRFVLMPSGANTELFSPLPQSEARRCIGLEGSCFYVGFAGSLLAHQGVDILIDAAEKVLHQIPDCRFIIIGEGPMKVKWKESAHARGLETAMQFTGQIPYHRLPDWINAMDVCVAPYAADAGYRSPVKIFDYLACAKPVVASRIPGTTDVFDGIASVFLVPPENPAALAKQISDLLLNEQKRTQCGNAGRQWVVKNCSRSEMAKRVSTEAAKLLRSRRY